MKKKYEIWVDDLKVYVRISAREAMKLKARRLINYDEIEFQGVVYIEPIKKEKL